MFPAAAIAIRNILTPVEFKVVVNLGSSTSQFFQKKQPYIWEQVMAPLLDRGNALFNVDQKPAKGVHLIGDARTWNIPEFADVVLCCNILEHVTDPQEVIDNIWITLKSRGLVVIEGPAEYPRHADPIDNMLRPKTGEEWDTLFGARFERLHFETVTMDKHPEQTATVVVLRKVAR